MPCGLGPMPRARPPAQPHSTRTPPADRDTFYTATHQGGGADGYTDYPNLDGSIGTQGKYALIEQDSIGGPPAAAAPKSRL